MINTDLFDRATKFAIDAHKNVERRGKRFPYIIHPMEAVAIVATISDDEELLAATILHDVVEDTDFTVEDIRKNFGDRVASLVEYESDIVFKDRAEHESWHDRKQIAIDRIANASRECKIISLGDKLSNMRAIYMDYCSVGDNVWDKFHVKDKAEHKWHYEGLANALSELNDTFAYKEFKELVKKVFG